MASSEVITDESGMPELPSMGPGMKQGKPAMDIELDGEEITLENGKTIFIHYLPDGTLPIPPHSEDVTEEETEEESEE